MPRLPLVVSILLAGCAGVNPGRTPPRDPLAVAADPKAHSDARIKAIRASSEAAREGATEPLAVRETLKKIAWSRSTFDGIRLEAIRALLTDEERLDDTRKMLRLMLPTETHWRVVASIGEAAAERGWTDLSAALVRCWSRPASLTDDERPERGALERLHPGRPVEDVVFAVFAGEPGVGPAERSPAEPRDRERQDAWSLLRRLDKSGERTRALLAGPARADEDRLLSILRAGARELGVVPSTPEETAWLERLHALERGATWRDLAAGVARLGEEQRRGLELRHALGVRWASANRPETLAASREELLSKLDAALEGRKRHTRLSAATAGRRAPESLRTWRERMSWGDALLALIAAEAVEHAPLAAPLFSQAEEDRADVSTEYGGVIDGTSGGFVLRMFTPRPAQRFGDRRFVASPEMIEQGSDALFHYHLHCTSYDNADYAGPSEDDIQYARRQGRSCIVFTFVSKDALNADYYQPDGATIDLGTIRRPR